MNLSHVSIRTADLDACRRFYVEVLGLQLGPRPDFPFPGLWLYAGDTSSTANAVVHVIGIDPDDAEGLQRYLGGRDTAALHGSGAVDHIAFAATGLAAMRERLRRLGIDAREREVPGLRLRQLFLHDPHGIVVELNYPADEAA